MDRARKDEELLSRSEVASSLLSLSRQQRNLLLTRPLYEIALRTRQEESKLLFENLDTNYLCLCAIDYIMEGGVLGLGRTREDVLQYLSEIAWHVKPTLTEDGAGIVAREILDSLHNAANGYERFDFEYFDASTAETQRFPFFLLKYERAEDDAYYYRVSDEGFLVYLGMLDLGAENMQMLMEKMLAELVRRGRVSEAVEVSRQAYLQAARYHEAIRSKLDRAERVPDSLTWQADLDPFLTGARAHIDEREVAERQLLHIVTDKLRETEEIGTRDKLVRLKDTVERESRIHTHLLQLVGNAGERYLRAQAAMFRARGRQQLPDLERQVLPEFLVLHVAELNRIADTGGHSLFSASAPRLFRLSQVVELLLERQPESVSPDRIEDELVNVGQLLPYFSSDAIQAAIEFLRRALDRDEQIDIEAILLDAEREGIPRPVQEYMTFLMYQAFAREESMFDVKVSAGGRFRTRVVEGSRLSFSPAVEKP